MKSESMLAEVFASANEKHFADEGDSGAAPLSGNQQTETPMSDKTNAAADQPKTESVADLTAAYPALCGQIAGDAAKAERERIQGILSLPSSGHDKLVTDAIADGKSTKAEVALGILEAEKATRSKRMDALKGVEAEAAVVNAAPNAGGSGTKKTYPATADGWKAEWEAAEADSDLRREFATADHYVAFSQGVANGSVRILKSR